MNFSYDDLVMMTLLITPLLFAVILTLHTIFNKPKKPTYKLPPCPKKLPIIGNLHQLNGKLPHRALHTLSTKHGDKGLMYLQLGSIPSIVISSSDILKEIFKSHDRAFSGRPPLYAGKKLSYNCSSVSFAPYGDHWREMRRVMMTELLSPRRVKSYEATRVEEVALMINSIKGRHEKKGLVNLSELALSLANRVVCRLAFRLEGGEGRFVKILGEAQDLLGEMSLAEFFPRWLWWLNKLNGLEGRLEKCFRELDRFYDGVIDEHVHAKKLDGDHDYNDYDDEDVVDVMLRLKKDPNQPITLTNDHIKGVLADTFIAGSDTSAAIIVWTMAELNKNPSIMEKAKREVREALKGKGKVEESDTSKLTYLKMVIKESLRLHPPVPLLVPRETIEHCQIEGYDIPKKTRVFINTLAVFTDEKYWKNPSEFLPERFSENPIDFRGQNFEFIPFGAGRRGCPGINFSIPLIELALASLLYHFDWRLPHGMREEEVDMEEAMGLTTHKKIPLCLVPSCP